MLSTLENNDKVFILFKNKIIQNNLNIDITTLSREIEKLRRNSSDVLRNYNNI